MSIVLTTYADPFYVATFELSGTRYVFDFAYSQREDAWYFDLATEAGDQVAHGIRVSGGCDLFLFTSGPHKPAGILQCLGPHDPGLNDLAAGGACFLRYTGDDE